MTETKALLEQFPSLEGQNPILERLCLPEWQLIVLAAGWFGMIVPQIVQLLNGGNFIEAGTHMNHGKPKGKHGFKANFG